MIYPDRQWLKTRKYPLPLILGEHVRAPFSTSRHRPVCDASSGIFKALANVSTELDLDEIRVKTRKNMLAYVKNRYERRT